MPLTSNNNKKPPAQVVGLRTLTLRGTAPPSGPALFSGHQQPSKKRVFTDAEWAKLLVEDTPGLVRRILQGDYLIKLLHRPEMMNMTARHSATVASNLKYQQEAIASIIKARGADHVAQLVAARPQGVEAHG